jgi:peptidoglycan/LPS O-acetylase OafA/YrhL
MPEGDSVHKLPVLDGLRAISVLLVLACHLLPLGPKELRLNETAGAMGMSLFFALSGFLIMTGLMRNANVTEFLARRLGRILPLVWLYTLFVFILYSFRPWHWVWSNLLIVNYKTDYLDSSWNAHLWSLCVEVQFYMAIALVALLFGRRGLWIVWPACSAITLSRIAAGPDGYLSIATHLRVDEILSGACVATIMVFFEGRRLFRRPHAVIGAAVALWVISADPWSGPLQFARPYVAAFLLLAVLRYGAAKPATWLESGRLRYIATISYALYVIHPATAYGWMSEGSLAVKYLLKRPISLILTFALAHLSTFYWERPWQTAVKHWIRKRREGAVSLSWPSPGAPCPESAARR